MSYLVTILGKISFLEVILSGKRENGSECRDGIEALSVVDFYASQYHLNKILIRFKLSGKSQREEVLKMLSEIENKDWAKKYKVALYYHDKAQFLKDSFTHILAKELGWNVGFFDNYTTAKEWILLD